MPRRRCGEYVIFILSRAVAERSALRDARRCCTYASRAYATVREIFAARVRGARRSRDAAATHGSGRCVACEGAGSAARARVRAVPCGASARCTRVRLACHAFVVRHPTRVQPPRRCRCAKHFIRGCRHAHAANASVAPLRSARVRHATIAAAQMFFTLRMHVARGSCSAHATWRGRRQRCAAWRRAAAA